MHYFFLLINAVRFNKFIDCLLHVLKIELSRKQLQKLTKILNTTKISINFHWDTTITMTIY